MMTDKVYAVYFDPRNANFTGDLQNPGYVKRTAVGQDITVRWSHHADLKGPLGAFVRMALMKWRYPEAAISVVNTHKGPPSPVASFR